MMNETVITIIGGDNRQGYLAKSLSDDGIPVIVNGLEKYSGIDKVQLVTDTAEAVSAADVVILPLPLTHDNITVHAPYSYSAIYLSDVFAAASPGQLLMGGRINEKLMKAVNNRNIRLVDYWEREELSVLNAIPTAEGALEIAMRETQRTIFDSNCLVIGYGRIGKILSGLLKSMGAHVTASARKAGDLAWIKSAGLTPVATGNLLNVIGECDIIFNTVPHVVLELKELLACKPGVVIIDLASAPGGVDFAAANQNGIEAIQALSLPGKVAPESAAEMIKETILNIIREENI